MTLLLRRRKPPKMGIKDPSIIRSPQHLQWVRLHRCLLDGQACSDRIEAAHVRVGTDGGTAMKPSDCWTVPLCSTHHMEQHQIGEPAFERKYSIRLKERAAIFWDKSPHRLKFERKANG